MCYPTQNVYSRYIMTQETKKNNNTGALFKNKDKKTPNQPDYKGNVSIEGKKYLASGWIKQVPGKDDYISLSLTDPDTFAKKTWNNNETKPENNNSSKTTEGGANQSPPAQSQDDDVPFDIDSVMEGSSNSENNKEDAENIKFKKVDDDFGSIFG